MTLWFANFHAFLDMNGYALYVWPAWLMVLGLLLVQYLHSRHERRQVLADIQRQERRKAAQQSPGQVDPHNANAQRGSA